MGFWENVVRKATTRSYTGSENDVDTSKRFHMDAPTSYRNLQRGSDGTYSSGTASIAGNAYGGRTVGGEENLPTSGKTYVPRASSAIASVDYDPASNTASVTYTKGKGSYDFDVSPEEMRQFINAPSKGRWVHYVWRKYNQKEV